MKTRAGRYERFGKRLAEEQNNSEGRTKYFSFFRKIQPTK